MQLRYLIKVMILLVTHSHAIIIYIETNGIVIINVNYIVDIEAIYDMDYILLLFIIIVWNYLPRLSLHYII